MRTAILLFCFVHTFTSFVTYAQDNLPKSGPRNKNYNNFLVKQLDSIYADDQTTRQQLHT